MKARYERNIDALTKEECKKLREKRICIVGCGGLGGYILEQFLRIGAGKITVIDGDCFDETNLNRQLLSNESVIGCSKAETAKEKAGLVNGDVEVTAIHMFLTVDNAEELLKNHDIIMDAVDNIEARKIMASACKKLNIPLVYGAIQGWYAQISFIKPGSSLLDMLYQDHVKLVNKSCLAFTPAVCASFQVAEAVKYLCGRECSLEGKVLYIDMLSMESEVISFSDF